MAKNGPAMTTDTATTRRGPRPTLGNLGRARRDIQSELQKVTWPTWEQTRNLSIVVIAVCLVMAAFLFGVDTLLTQIIRLIISI